MGNNKTSDVKPEEKAIYINIISDKELRALTAKDKLTFKNNMVTLQEIDVRLRKSLMGDSKIKLYEYGSLYIKGFGTFIIKMVPLDTPIYLATQIIQIMK
ncbi:exotoxin beta-grasp domain-containing protein [Streptococcus pyogenes]|uniref:exotoxin beta-grasp domain-containing protein n=1 Tax=Streptococcus pyogenes TaxID=1314 RepID=UPI0023B3303F|nr:exotoxin beta-grasp domain-containing protein [Streptococcus pyogenes]